MPELPDIELYLHVLRSHTVGQTLNAVRLRSAFLLRTVEPPLSAAHGQPVTGFHRIGKRIVFEFPDDLFFVLHLMIAGRLQWKKPDAKIGGRMDLAAFDFDHGTLVLTEASKKKRAKLHVVRGRAALADHDPGGLEPLAIDAKPFVQTLKARHHTITRAPPHPTTPRGTGNPYSDQMLCPA